MLAIPSVTRHFKLQPSPSCPHLVPPSGLCAVHKAPSVAWSSNAACIEACNLLLKLKLNLWLKTTKIIAIIQWYSPHHPPHFKITWLWPLFTLSILKQEATTLSWGRRALCDLWQILASPNLYKKKTSLILQQRPLVTRSLASCYQLTLLKKAKLHSF